ncbi:DivIVA domain-containing protein [Verrucosispora sp. WMMC514]|uniref:DivIVA domain-containing protein n=1 Tax=Verrucosispora sp. WMMC514 TaxID=3015156 RepID=UPI00248C8A86|nr:DivIVA domain-containing protein [Verrucosispora sp. WMMC514]WBB90680.1 DivIVA domain-containing protein [Verrucosispora sp. WMMC514]
MSTYRSTAYSGLLPWQVRGHRFRRVWLGRRGLAPDEVYAFLDRVAGELATVQQALAESHRETARVRIALRDWQSARARARGGDR